MRLIKHLLENVYYANSAIRSALFSFKEIQDTDLGSAAPQGKKTVGRPPVISIFPLIFHGCIMLPFRFSTKLNVPPSTVFGSQTGNEDKVKATSYRGLSVGCELWRQGMPLIQRWTAKAGATLPIIAYLFETRANFPTQSFCVIIITLAIGAFTFYQLRNNNEYFPRNSNFTADPHFTFSLLLGEELRGARSHSVMLSSK